MAEREVKIPDASHPIHVTPATQRVSVYAGDRLVARSEEALTLDEAGYPPVQYVPLVDVEEGLLRASDTTTYCPYKGEASYYTVLTDDGELQDAGWSYPEAYDAVDEITGHVAWDTDKVRVELG